MLGPIVAGFFALVTYAIMGIIGMIGGFINLIVDRAGNRNN